MFEAPHQEMWSDHTLQDINKHELPLNKLANAHIVQFVDSDTVHKNIMDSM